MPDIDIDFANRKLALAKLKHITAAIDTNGTFKKHNTGVYCHSIPYNPVTELSTIAVSYTHLTLPTIYSV